MKDTLTLEDLAPYLPYDLKIIGNDPHPLYTNDDNLFDKYGYTLTVYTITGCVKYQEKPLLRNLSDLTKEIEVNGERFVPVEELSEVPFNICVNGFKTMHVNSYDLMLTNDNLFVDPEGVPVGIIKRLYQWHFDVNNLIGRGLAIDINTLKK